jgi:hypothetical protein
MTTRIYEFGSAAAGLHFTITATENLITGLTDFTVDCLSGSFDLNAVYWGDGDKTDDDLPGADMQGNWTGKSSENSLNMNGDNIEYDDNGVATAKKVVYDGGYKVSDTGPRPAGHRQAVVLDRRRALHVQRRHRLRRLLHRRRSRHLYQHGRWLDQVGRLPR